jgi:hypothetical protein
VLLSQAKERARCSFYAHLARDLFFHRAILRRFRIGRKRFNFLAMPGEQVSFRSTSLGNYAVVMALFGRFSRAMRERFNALPLRHEQRDNKSEQGREFILNLR